uniref:Uncharacterized protein n=1 Tax=Trypanosoma congolense (strain IL3000) TaxID=1068625 RepID=F9WIL5_TRYCI|nr:hypothetical protein, unlikely [Trypanosoma congolense IL3000]
MRISRWQLWNHTIHNNTAEFWFLLILLLCISFISLGGRGSYTCSDHYDTLSFLSRRSSFSFSLFITFFPRPFPLHISYPFYFYCLSFFILPQHILNVITSSNVMLHSVCSTENDERLILFFRQIFEFLIVFLCISLLASLFT